MDLRTININQYRIKTKDEAIKEFEKIGSWRTLCSFPREMDYLLGCKLSDLKIVNKHKELIIIQNLKNSKYNGILFGIRKKMIKKIINKKEKIQWI